MTAMSLRERVLLAEQEKDRHAKLALAEHNIAHELTEYAKSGSALDDHHTIAGFCPTCSLHIIRVYWATGRIEDSLMSAEQRRILGARGAHEASLGTTIEDCCRDCGSAFAFDEPRHYVKLGGRGLGVYQRGHVCASCVEKGEYRDVLTTSTIREEAEQRGIDLYPRPYSVALAEGGR